MRKIKPPKERIGTFRWYDSHLSHSICLTCQAEDLILIEEVIEHSRPWYGPPKYVSIPRRRYRDRAVTSGNIEGSGRQVPFAELGVVQARTSRFAGRGFQASTSAKRGRNLSEELHA